MNNIFQVFLGFVLTLTCFGCLLDEVGDHDYFQTFGKTCRVTQSNSFMKYDTGFARRMNNFELWISSVLEEDVAEQGYAPCNKGKNLENTWVFSGMHSESNSVLGTYFSRPQIIAVVERLKGLPRLHTFVHEVIHHYQFCGAGLEYEKNTNVHPDKYFDTSIRSESMIRRVVYKITAAINEQGNSFEVFDDLAKSDECSDLGLN